MECNKNSPTQYILLPKIEILHLYMANCGAKSYNLLTSVSHLQKGRLMGIWAITNRTIESFQCKSAGF